MLTQKQPENSEPRDDKRWKQSGGAWWRTPSDPDRILLVDIADALLGFSNLAYTVGESAAAAR